MGKGKEMMEMGRGGNNGSWRYVPQGKKRINPNPKNEKMQLNQYVRGRK